MKTFKDFKFTITPSFWLLGILSLLLKRGFLFSVYTISVLIHEFAHFFVAKKLKYNCKSIKLSAFGAVLYGDFLDVDAKDSALIAIAGPTVNLILTVLVFATWWVYPSLYTFTVDFLYSNIALAIVNLLPCYPLDGGRVVVALLRKKHGYSKALKISRVLSLCLGCVFFALFIMGIVLKQNLYSCGLFGFFLTVIGGTETKDNLYSKKPYMGINLSKLKQGIEKKCLVFNGDTILLEVVKKLKENYYYQITVIIDEKNFFVIEQPQINYCLTVCSLDTPLKNLLKYKV